MVRLSVEDPGSSGSLLRLVGWVWYLRPDLLRIEVEPVQGCRVFRVGLDGLRPLPPSSSCLYRDTFADEIVTATGVILLLRLRVS